MSRYSTRNIFVIVFASLLAGAWVEAQELVEKSRYAPIKQAELQEVLVEDLTETDAAPTNAAEVEFTEEFHDNDAVLDQVVFQLEQPTPLRPAPQAFESNVNLSPAAQEFADTILSSRDSRTTLLEQQRRRSIRSFSDVVFSKEAKFRATSDTGNLLGKSPSVTGVQATSRSPIITDTRIHGSHVGQLIASGSYWFPARQDLDTALSKIDSRIVDDVIVIKGPFAARYGPGFDFVDFLLLQSPRFQNGYESHGSSSAEYKTNGEQWYGRQSFWGGDENYGFRIGYGIRTGSDFHDANGDEYLSSYKSQDVDIAYGYDFTPSSHLELSYIWQEQNDVEVPTQLLDIDHLVTHGVEAVYVEEQGEWFDSWTLETWYNQTNLTGNANSPAKGRADPFLGQNIQSIVSNAANMSTGFSLNGDVVTEAAVTTVGVDVRYLEQEVNQFSNVNGLSFPNLFGNNDTPEVNGPVPEAYTANPGIFFERTKAVSERLTISTGGRADLVKMNAATIADEVGGLSGPLGLVGPNGEFPFVYNPNGDPVNFPPPTGTVPGVPVELDDLLLGSFNKSYGLGSMFIDADYEVVPKWIASCGFGLGMRAPTMTELYSLQHISTILPQQTFSILFGNPNLKSERRYQLNLGLSTNQEWFKARVNGFGAWIEDYVTYDAFDPNFYLFQTVNTDLATLAGFDFASELMLTNKWSTFLNASYTEGRDHTRTSNPVVGLQDTLGNELRSGIAGREKEWLPNMPPLQAILGLRLDDGHVNSRWAIETSARFVHRQDKIAASLGEQTTPGYTVLDVRGNWKATRNFTINAGVENFGNKQYQDHLDPHGRVLPLNPFAPGTEQSLGTVFRPGANFYFVTELTY